MVRAIRLNDNRSCGNMPKAYNIIVLQDYRVLGIGLRLKATCCELGYRAMAIPWVCGAKG